MANAADLISSPHSENVYIRSLSHSTIFRPDYEITYVLQGNPGDPGILGGALWAAQGAAAAFELATQAWEAVANITITPVEVAYDGSGSRAGYTWVETLEDLGGSTLGQHSLPGLGDLGGSFNNALALFTTANNAVGGYSFLTMLHEIGHGLGLLHPHAASSEWPGVSGAFDTGDNQLNQTLYTVMSYNDTPSPSDAYGWSATPMAFDIAAIQHLYGANMTTATGDDVYLLPTANAPGTYWSTIWDAGGIDTISGVGATTEIEIDMRAATLLNEYGGGGFASQVDGIEGGFFIANSVVIENAIGGDFDDWIFGNEFDNRIEGGAGDDQLLGGLGEDTIYGGDGNDRIYALYTDSPSLSAFDQSNYLYGDAGGDALYGAGGDDFLFGGDDGDNLYGGSGNDELSGDAGDDRLDGDDGDDLLMGGDGDDRLLGDNGSDILQGGAGADELRGGDGDDQLFGGDGDDVVDGGSGLDLMAGGAGNDFYYLREGETAFELPDEGIDEVSVNFSAYLGANIENLTLESEDAAIYGVGNELDNIIGGNGLNNLLIGGAGNDDIRGQGGDDQLFGETGNDKINGGGGIDYIVGGEGDDELTGHRGADAIYGGDGDDVLDGDFRPAPPPADPYAGASLRPPPEPDFVTDILVGGAGNDVLLGASGLNDYDLMYGGPGDDVYYVDTGDDLTFEAADEGNDTVFADVSNVPNAGVYLYANVENLVLLGSTAFGVGNELDNQLTGSASANWLLGGAGNDLINGKGGNDVLFGETGIDTFVFENGTGGDVIGDFNPDEDLIDVSDFGFASFAQLAANFAQVGADGAIYLDADDFIVLHGVTMADLDAGDFIL